MKIVIDLNDILGDESGVETLQDSVRRQVVTALTKTITTGVGRRIDTELSSVLDVEIRKAIEGKMPAIVDELLEAKYVQVDKFGHSTGQATSVREQLVKAINDEMVYKKADYNGKKNAFSNAIDSLVAVKMKEFQGEFNKLVDAQFCKEAFDYATTRLRDRLGIKV